MAANSVSPIGIVEAVEVYIDALPATRRRKRTRAEIDADYDTTPEIENYGPAVEPPPVCILDSDAQVQLIVLLYQLNTSRNDAATKAVFEKICALVGLDTDGDAFDAAAAQIRRKGAK